MIGIMVFSHRLILLYALKHFLKHSPHGIFKETVSVTRDDALDKQYWISQSVLISDRSVFDKMLPVDDNGHYIYGEFRTVADNQPDMSLSSSWLMLITNQTLCLSVKLMTDADNQPGIMSLSSSWLMLITNKTLCLSVKLMTDVVNQPDIMSLSSSWLLLITNQTLCQCQAHDWCLSNQTTCLCQAHDWCW